MSACACGGAMRPATRYEADRTVPVRCCFDCGAEWPPLYRRNKTQRSGRTGATAFVCRGCGCRFFPESGKQPLYCSHACSGPAGGFKPGANRRAG